TSPKTNYWSLSAGSADNDEGSGFNRQLTGNLRFSAGGILVGFIEDDIKDSQRMNFTGQHRTISDSKDLYQEKYIGYIVSTTSRYKSISGKTKPTSIKNNIDINDALPIVELSIKEKDKSVFGVISNRIEDQQGVYTIGHFVSVYPKDNGDDRLVINGCGEGSIWVSDYNGVLENGDYITTSPISGIGMKQDDDILRNYTVAKITMSCDFEPQLIPVEVIKQEEYVEYNTSNVTSNIEWYDYNSSNMTSSNIEYIINVPNVMTSNVIDIYGEPVYEYKLDETSNIVYDYEYDMKYIKLDGEIVDKDYYLNNSNVYRMAFVGCAYKCS
ncbi:hypothetical protein, partial [Flavobacterium sp.]|uniref:hypothetical protein n=1 Tax=Flavobacterium sp. TaxID=239 RepID=UPI0037C0C3E0